MRSSVEYLCQVIYQGKLAMPNRKFPAISGMKPLRTITNMWSFLGLRNGWRRFIPNFARPASPLTAILKSGEPTRFGDLGESTQAGFLQLRSKISSPRIGATPARAPIRVGHRLVRQSGRQFIDATQRRPGPAAHQILEPHPVTGETNL